VHEQKNALLSLDSLNCNFTPRNSNRTNNEKHNPHGRIVKFAGAKLLAGPRILASHASRWAF
jgi:hypothetical protein